MYQLILRIKDQACVGKDELNILRVILVQTGVICLAELYQTLCSVYFITGASRTNLLSQGRHFEK